ncbi:MAG: hypothetical protein OXC60_06340 [Litoreibacter sp.]|nr:hypothetical protein [Litoreibacter sp.]MCY4334276.1 hypothetical protein [Litoreibacter sp.]
MTQIHHIPIAPIVRDMLRQAIEVWASKTPRGPCLYRLISGHRRLDAVQASSARWASCSRLIHT